MPPPENEKERWRLAHFYARMSDGELEKLADDAGALSDLAKRALQFEISKRGLDSALREAPPAEPPAFSKLVMIARFRDVPEAYIAKGVLDSTGIECFLFDANIIWADWFWSNAVGGVKLLVREEDASEAAGLLGANLTESTGNGESVGFASERCPNCASADVTYQGLMKRLAYFTVWLGLPIPVKHVAWKCHSCGHAWEDAAQPSQPPR